MQVLDRRLNPGGKNLENRQRFLRRAKAIVQQAVRQASKSRDISDILEGGEVSIPARGVDEPRFHHGGGGIRDQVLPGNKKFAEGDVLPRSGGGGGSSQDGGSGEGEDAFRFVLTREEFLDLFLDDLELPDLAKRRLAEVEHEGVRRAGYSVSGSPVNIAIGRTMRHALGRRIALRRPNPQASGAARGKARRLRRRRRSRGAAKRDRGARSQNAAHSLYRSDRHSLSAFRERAESRWRRR